MKKSFGAHLPKKTVFDRFGLKTKNLLCTQMPRSLIWHYLFVWGSSTIIKKKITCLVNFSIFFSFFRKTSFWRICQLWLRIPEKLKILRTKVTAFFDSFNSHLLSKTKRHRHRHQPAPAPTGTDRFRPAPDRPQLAWTGTSLGPVCAGRFFAKN